MKTIFNELDFYRDESYLEYQLLPFNFALLDSDRYLITNMVGEYLILSKDQLQKLINKKLDPDEILYNELLSKHFIYSKNSDVSIDLLSLKYRTKKFYLSDFTSLHIFVVSLRCDHSCPYCQVSRQNIKTSEFDMSQEIADKGIEFAFRSPSRNLKFEFQGGEPLLNFKIIKYIVLKVSEINELEKRNIQFVITTNLSFINKEVLDFCSEFKILISTSLDGPEDLHNKNRPKPGKDSYQKTIEGINYCRDILGVNSISALMTTTKHSLTRVKDIIDEYINQEFNSIFLRPLSPYGFAIKTKNYYKYDADEWLKFYFEGLDYIIELNKNGYFFVEQYASIILTKMLSTSDTGYVDLQSPSGVGIGAIVFNYNGDVYVSDEARMLAEMHDQTFRIGSLISDSYEDIISSETLLDILEQTMTESMPGCSECAFQPFCGSDPVYHYATQKDIVGNKTESMFCHKNMTIFKKIINYLEDKNTKDILRKWVF